MFSCLTNHQLCNPAYLTYPHPQYTPLTLPLHPLHYLYTPYTPCTPLTLPLQTLHYLYTPNSAQETAHVLLTCSPVKVTSSLGCNPAYPGSRFAMELETADSAKTRNPPHALQFHSVYLFSVTCLRTSTLFHRVLPWF